MTDPRCERWMALTDKASIGIELCDADRDFITEHGTECLQCLREARLWSSLGSVMLQPEMLDTPVDGCSKVAFAPLSRRSKAPSRAMYGWALGLVATAALTLGGVWLLASSRMHAAKISVPEAHLVSSAGQVQLGAHPARAGERLEPKQTLSTQAGQICFSLAGTITTCLDEHSEAALVLDDPTQITVQLIRGKLLARLDPQPSHRPFQVQTPSGRVIARGTVFSVSIDSRRSTVVRLHQGRVSLRTVTNQVQDLIAPSAAELWQTIGLRPWSDSLAAQDAALLSVSKLPRQGKLTRLDVWTDPPGASVDLDGIPLGLTPVSAHIAQGHQLSVSMNGFAPVAEILPADTQGPIERMFALVPSAPGSSDAHVDLSAAEARSPAPIASSVLTPSALLARAQSLRSQAQYRDCAATYRQLIANFPRSDEARVSLVSLGELELSELGQAGHALHLFESYLRKGGPLAREARYGKIRALQALGRAEELRNASAEFIRDFPNSVQAATLRGRQQAQSR